jgi:hypothetical protein
MTEHLRKKCEQVRANLLAASFRRPSVREAEERALELTAIERFA